MDPELYKDREQTYIKHFVLRKYLEKLAYKVGTWCSTINYIDCFAGPWKQKGDNLEDTSPMIAINELQKVRNGLAKTRKFPKFRCLFIEKSPESWALLNSTIAEVKRIECIALNGSFEEKVDEIVSFCQEGSSPSQTSFNFFFIDPTGWTGFPLDVLLPIFQQRPNEILINFMTQHIQRFIGNSGDTEDVAFQRLFGSLDVRKRWSSLEGTARELEIVNSYSDTIRESGSYEHVGPTIVLHPTDNRTHFHLIYATNHPEGLRTFRNSAEKPAIREQKATRWKAQNEKSLARSGQTSLFDEPYHETYLDELEKFYYQEMEKDLCAFLASNKKCRYLELELRAFQWPLTNRAVLRSWIKKKEDEGRIRIEGLGKRERTLKHNKEHFILWIDK